MERLSGDQTAERPHCSDRKELSVTDISAEFASVWRKQKGRKESRKLGATEAKYEAGLGNEA